MNRWMMAGALGLGAAVLLFQGSVAPVVAQAKAAPGWHKDLPTAKAEAKRTGKPMFLVFR
jgi:hypothetical protein